MALFLYVAAKKHYKDQGDPEKNGRVILQGCGKVQAKQGKACMGESAGRTGYAEDDLKRAEFTEDQSRCNEVYGYGSDGRKQLLYIVF